MRNQPADKIAELGSLGHSITPCANEYAKTTEAGVYSAHMKCTPAILLVGFLCTVLASDGAAPKLEPNAIISFEFPDLPETLLTKSSGDKQPARLSAELPENYSRETKFPLISKSPTTEHQSGRAPFGPMDWQTSDGVEAPCTHCAARTRNIGETPPTNWQTAA